tara:strand:+ start:2730 stop:3242 length:513 start_codon:yes stop_codon:yes gene_type:complete
MANTRLYRENITFLLAHPEAFADRTAPTVAELNGALVHNVTCALNEDGTEFTLGDSDTDDSLTFCSKAGISTPTFYNPTVMMEAFRDSDVTATGIFNEAFDLLAWPDIEYIAILRVGKDSDTAFAVADKIKMVGVKTDLGTDVVASGENMRIAQAFMNNDFVNWNYEVAA